MIERSAWFQLNSPRVVYDMVDHEVVLVDLESGAYYSTEKVGATIWQHLDRGECVGEIIQSVAGQYAGALDAIEKEVDNLIGELLREGLIVPGNATSSGRPQTGSANPLPDHPVQHQKQPFEGVVLHKFVDMQDLLLLDPVHQVDDLGWPHASNQ